MRIELADIPKHGLDLKFGLDQQAVRTAVGEALEGPLTELIGTLRVTREAEGVVAEVKGRALVTRPCDTCGHPLTLPVEVDTRLAYVPISKVDEEDPAITSDTLDLGFLEGDALETEAVLAEAFVLDAPRRVTCEDASCPHARSLEQAAGTSEGASAFSVLKKLL